MDRDEARLGHVQAVEEACDLGPAAVAPRLTWARISRTRAASVTYMNPPTWTDDELLRELSAALREPVVDEGFIRAARIAFTRRMAGAGPES